MSSKTHGRHPTRFRTLCAACRARKARFRYRGRVRADRDHTLCFECYRGQLNRARAHQLIAPIFQATHRSGLGHGERVGGESRERQVAHRLRMLAHLQRHSGMVSGCQS
jgi:hypothetical protein